MEAMEDVEINKMLDRSRWNNHFCRAREKLLELYHDIGINMPFDNEMANGKVQIEELEKIKAICDLIGSMRYAAWEKRSHDNCKCFNKQPNQKDKKKAVSSYIYDQ